MPARLILAPDVEFDLSDAYAWYEKRRRGLGDEFLRDLKTKIWAICRNPERFQVVHETYRRALLRRFPYAVFYEHQDGVVTIYCVCHTARDVKEWQSRLP